MAAARMEAILIKFAFNRLCRQPGYKSVMTLCEIKGRAAPMFPDGQRDTVAKPKAWRCVMFDAVQRFDEPVGRRHEDAAIFGPELIAVMRRAFELSWSALAFAHFDTEHEIRATREELAKRILEGAAGGERRIPVLSGRALGALEPRSAGRSSGGSPWRSSRFDS
jgi:hypothetical protein